MPIDLNQNLPLLLAFFCLLPLLLTAALLFFLYRSGQQRLDAWFTTDHAQIAAKVDGMRAQDPAASTERLVHRLIHQQAVKAGLVGALTGLGGFWTLPIGLPIDLAVSYRIQAALVTYIAYLYGDKHPDGLESRVRNVLLTTGSSKITQTTTGLVSRVAVRVLGKSFAKLVPLLGALISFALNYLLVQLMGRAAMRWYSARSSDSPGAPLSSV
jgi:hypothetical protein